MSPVDAFQLEKWERGESDPHFLTQFLGACWHKYLPSFFGWNLSLPRLVGGTVRLGFLLGLSLAPIWTKFIEGTNVLNWWQAIGLAAALSVGLIYCHVYDRLARDRKARKSKAAILQKLSLELCGIMSSLGKAVKPKAKDQETAIAGLRLKVLQCLHRVAEIHLADYEGTYLEASLLLFNDASCSMMKISERATMQRPVGRTRPVDDLMAYFVARSGKHRVVHDFARDHPFAKTGFSGGKARYRSILMIPLLDSSSVGPDTCVGVVTIDSSRPYHFWSFSYPDASDLVVKISPYTTWIMVLLGMGSAVHKLSCGSSQPQAGAVQSQGGK
jgi:hypothetical protein